MLERLALKVQNDHYVRVSPKAEQEVECVEVGMQLILAKQVEVSSFLDAPEISCAHHYSHQVQVRGHRYGHEGYFFGEHSLRIIAENAALGSLQVIRLRCVPSVIPTVLKV